MKKFILFFVILTLALTLSVLSQDKEKKKEMTISGEVVDVKCYITGMMGGKGDDHKECAIDCIKGGLPVGVYDEKEKKVYSVVPKGGMKGANEEMVKYAASKVKLTGTLVKKDGAELFIYSKVEEVK